jgi:iron-sulfur cluster assembly protein
VTPTSFPTSRPSATPAATLPAPGARSASVDTETGAERGDLDLFRSQRPHDGDEVIDQHGARVFLEARAAEVLDDKVLDATVDGGGQVRLRVSAQP